MKHVNIWFQLERYPYVLYGKLYVMYALIILSSVSSSRAKNISGGWWKSSKFFYNSNFCSLENWLQKLDIDAKISLLRLVII